LNRKHSQNEHFAGRRGEVRPKFLDNSAKVFQFLSMFDTVTSANFYLFAIPAITLFGLSKGGLSALGPAFLVYVMPQKLEPKIFAGTSVIFFAIVNVLKLPPYFLLGQFSAENLLASAALMPVGIAATYVGVRMMRTVPASRFYNIVLILSFLLGAKLIFDSLREAWL
jgi:uncharacterized membrane protein YfcA